MSSRTSGSPSYDRTETKKPHVAILMCTYNGAPYLQEQLESFRRQSYKNWSLWVSDDGSTDETKNIIKNFSRTLDFNTCKINKGPEKGFFRNFLDVTTSNYINAEFYAWSDQDDIWKNEKIQRALNWLEHVNPKTPALYCTRTELINEQGDSIGLSPKFQRKPCFKNALVQSIAGGNTMVFNEAARILFKNIDKNSTAPAHDWLMYQLVSGSGGIVYYDSTPSLLYRQHSKNIIGSNSSISSRIKRIKMLIQGKFKYWNSQNILALEKSNTLQKENIELLITYKKSREEKLINRVTGMAKLGLYRQTFLGNIALVIAILIRKL